MKKTLGTIVAAAAVVLLTATFGFAEYAAAGAANFPYFQLGCLIVGGLTLISLCWRRLRRAKSGGAVPSIIGDWINISLSADYSKSGFAMFLNTVKCSSTL
jgi:H+/Cl- antiporter ClcA